jgi:hypothetical protein
LVVNIARARPPVGAAPRGGGYGAGGGGGSHGSRRDAEMCRDNQRGMCSRGSSCRFSHGDRGRSRSRTPPRYSRRDYSRSRSRSPYGRSRPSRY